MFRTSMVFTSVLVGTSLRVPVRTLRPSHPCFSRWCILSGDTRTGRGVVCATNQTRHRENRVTEVKQR